MYLETSRIDLSSWTLITFSVRCLTAPCTSSSQSSKYAGVELVPIVAFNLDNRASVFRLSSSEIMKNLKSSSLPELRCESLLVLERDIAEE